MVNRRFQEVAGGIAFVIAARRWVPMLQDGDHLRNVGIGRGSSGASRPHRRGYGEGRLQVSIGLLSGQDFWDPVVEGRAHFLAPQPGRLAKLYLPATKSGPCLRVRLGMAI